MVLKTGTQLDLQVDIDIDIDAASSQYVLLMEFQCNPWSQQNARGTSWRASAEDSTSKSLARSQMRAIEQIEDRSAATVSELQIRDLKPERGDTNARHSL